jgi:hypothetical protein
MSPRLFAAVIMESTAVVSAELGLSVINLSNLISDARKPAPYATLFAPRAARVAALPHLGSRSPAASGAGDERNTVGKVMSSQGDPEEEPQRRHRNVDGEWRDAARRQVKLVSPQILEGRLLRRPAEKDRWGRQRRHEAHTMCARWMT